MDTIKTVAVAAAGLAFVCMGAPIRSYVGVGAAFPSMHARIRGNGGGTRAGQVRRAAGRPNGPVIRNVHRGEDSLHRPWAGSISYERKKDEADARAAAHQMRQETRSMLDLMNDYPSYSGKAEGMTGVTAFIIRTEAVEVAEESVTDR